MARQYQEIEHEYARVSQWSKEPDLHNAARRVALTEAQTEALVKHYVPSCDVVFFPDAQGEARLHLGNKFIRFASNPLSDEDIANGKFYPRLHLAVVIHEIAHHVAGLHNYHNRAFVDAMDKIASECLEMNGNGAVHKWREIVAKQQEKEQEEANKKHRQKSLKEILTERCAICNEPAKEIGRSKTHIILICGHLISLESLRPKMLGDEFVTRDGKTLYPFQKENVEKFSEAQGKMLIADDMGLGKTWSGIAIAELYKHTPTLCVLKSATKYQWQRQIHNCVSTRIPFVSILESSDDVILAGADYVIVSYDLLARLKKNQIFTAVDPKTFQEVPIDYKLMILDECQQIKNMSTKRARAVTECATRIPNILGLSATPIRNNAMEYYTMLHMLRPRLFPTAEYYAARHVDSYRKGPYVKYTGLKSTARFFEETKEFISRHTQAEVLPQLPPVTRDFRFTKVRGKDLDELHQAENEFSDYYFENNLKDAESAVNILAYLTKMRHIVGRAKVEYAFDYISEVLENTDEKVLVFVQHHDVHERLRSAVTKLCLELEIKHPLEIVSGMDPKLRDDYQTKFNEDPNYRVMIASTQSGGEGLDLQKQCHNIVFVERQWTATSEEQAEGRVRRIGQLADRVNAVYFVAEDTLDEWNHELVEKKRVIKDQVMDHVNPNWNENQVLKELAAIVAARVNKRRFVDGEKK